MKTDIHPYYVEATVRCSCGNTFTTRSTKAELHVELCNECHPFFTGKQKLVDSGGRVERFQRRYGQRGRKRAKRADFPPDPPARSREERWVRHAWSTAGAMDPDRSLRRREYEAVLAALADPARRGRSGPAARRRRAATRSSTALVETWRGVAAGRATTSKRRARCSPRRPARTASSPTPEIERAEAAVAELEQELRGLLLPADPNDGRNVIVEIRGAEGGEEANLFARTSSRCTGATPSNAGGGSRSSRRAHPTATGSTRSRSWSRATTPGSASSTRAARTASSGCPVTESKGRIHTSAATVTVLPEADEVDVPIDPADLKIDVFRSTGPGGQSVNTTDSAVRITHLPTGHRRLHAGREEPDPEPGQGHGRCCGPGCSRPNRTAGPREQSEQRRSQVGGGGRSEKIRTYNFKENRVTDHRVNLTLHKLDRVLDGDLDELVDALSPTSGHDSSPRRVCRGRPSRRDARGRAARRGGT